MREKSIEAENILYLVIIGKNDANDNEMSRIALYFADWAMVESKEKVKKMSLQLLLAHDNFF